MGNLEIILRLQNRVPHTQEEGGKDTLRVFKYHSTLTKQKHLDN